ncbi:carbon storage regulator [Paenibacillus sp. SYP-B4298]|uniref:carbon storage regulator n=1 Tax=Paenibacillus sp. SYP-B4298 TaxID=2996034 RepID=UPI0022DD28BB|nr:carbon storage regulator [Paenibacillus sp. SYP-B4298]
MLVLGRKLGEYVVINDTIKVKVIRSETGQLRLAIDAPQGVQVIRGEVLEKQLQDNEENACTRPTL